MAINIKRLIVNSFLDLCKLKPLKNITISDILKETGISRQTFYNHFKSKNDLILWIYREIILVQIDPCNPPSDYYLSAVTFYKKLLHYRAFITQACKMTDPDSLSSYMLSFSTNWYIENLKKYHGVKTISDELLFSLNYTASACTYITLNWILDGMVALPEEVSLICDNCLPHVMRPYLKSQSRLS